MRLEELCHCGHNYGVHTNGRLGPCDVGDCFCTHFAEPISLIVPAFTSEQEAQRWLDANSR